MNVGSLFSGIGALDHGLQRAGYTHKFFCEIDPYARCVLRRHWPTVPIYEDVRTLRPDLPRVEFLSVGFPCTDISVLGQRSGLDGEQSGLWSYASAVVRQLRPRFVLVENVPSLLVRGMGDVLGDLAASGYDTEWDCFPAAAFGAPHIRARVWLVAYPAGFGDRLEEGTVFAGRQSIEHLSWWDTEPGVRRVDDGTPDRVDRLRGLGNGVVAPIAEWIGRKLMAA